MRTLRGHPYWHFFGVLLGAPLFGTSSLCGLGGGTLIWHFFAVRNVPNKGAPAKSAVLCQVRTFKTYGTSGLAGAPLSGTFPPRKKVPDKGAPAKSEFKSQGTSDLAGAPLSGTFSTAKSFSVFSQKVQRIFCLHCPPGVENVQPIFCLRCPPESK